MASPLKSLPRRLFELLEEQQEPFLLENGCSKKSFKSKGTLRCCWYLKNHGFRRRRVRGGGILRICLAAKLIYLKLIKKSLSWERSKPTGCFSEIRSEANAGGFHRLSSSSAVAGGELSGEIGWKELEHSPVSVLELHSDESSSEHNHSMEEKKPSSTSRLHTVQPRQLLLDYVKEMEEKGMDPCEFLGQKMNASIIMQEGGGDVAMLITHLLELDISGTRREWTHFHAEKREIGTEIGGIIFEEMRDECLFDMLLGFHCTLRT